MTRDEVTAAMKAARVDLTQGLVALVDEADFERVVGAGKWHAHLSRGLFYAGRNFPQREPGAPRQKRVHLHTFLTGWSLVDHRNGDTLDNRRENLREATRSQNSRNAGRRADNTSGFKGVSWHSGSRLWRAYITVNGQREELGSHKSPIEAARAYDAAAREHFGEFACVNFPLGMERGA